MDESNLIVHLIHLSTLFHTPLSLAIILILIHILIHIVPSLRSYLALVTQCLGTVMEMVTIVQTALILYLPTTQHRILTELMNGVIAIYDDHRNQLFQKFPEIIHAVAEKACSDIEVGL